MLRPEVQRTVPWWSWLGGLSGAGLGFIIANLPGLMLGAVAGNRLGAIRDAKGKSVAAVFNDLGGQQKAEVRVSVLPLQSEFHYHHRSSVLWLSRSSGRPFKVIPDTKCCMLICPLDITAYPGNSSLS